MRLVIVQTELEIQASSDSLFVSFNFLESVQSSPLVSGNALLQPITSYGDALPFDLGDVVKPCSLSFLSPSNLFLYILTSARLNQLYSIYAIDLAYTRLIVKVKGSSHFSIRAKLNINGIDTALVYCMGFTRMGMSRWAIVPGLAALACSQGRQAQREY